jgi:radical SAM family uncharacterized protein/radical SAM-linked protein
LVNDSSLRDIIWREILPRVEKASRYLGNEWNSVHKDPAEVEFRVCLFFPDLYELGLGNLGLHILYAILNDLDGVWAERGYAPAPDLEKLLRERGLPLFMYESKDPLDAADLIGFTLQSELTYTSLVNAIDLAGLPLRSVQRGDAHPLLFAGGPCAYNPEPLAPFLDFFVIGDGEEAVVEVVDALRPLRHAPRRQRLEAVTGLHGVYVPELYPMETLPNGQIVPVGGAPKIVRRVVRDLDGAKFPERYLVPFTQLVHDGVSLEVLRGCTQGCRFCHAGMVNRPVRERSLDRIAALAERTLADTGLENVSLVSLSTCDYSRARALVTRAGDIAHRVKASVSLPSLRLDTFSVELADQVSDIRRSGLTFAPEAATPRLRAVINKFIPDEDLIRVACEAFRRGWEHIKVYFMIGLPTEREEDVLAIADLCLRTLAEGRRIRHGAMLRTGVSTFVPKPFTPFQWARQIGLEETRQKQELLAEAFHKHRGIKFGRHSPETSFLEGLLSRGDRRAADLIEAAWRHGARLDSWDEELNFEAWLQAIQETGFDVEGQFRERARDERLPWDHIDMLIPKSWFEEEWGHAMQLECARDCRSGECNVCGVMGREPDLCHRMRETWRQGHAEDAVPGEQAPRRESPPPREALQRIRFRIGRVGEARFLSHLEMQAAWVRALRRAHVPVAYSQGFHAHPKINFSTAAPLGEESEGDYLDVALDEFRFPDEILPQVRAALPRDFRAYEAVDVPLRAPALMTQVTGFRYTLHPLAEMAVLEPAVQELLGRERLVVTRKAKASYKGTKRREAVEMDIRPMVESLAVRGDDAGEPVIEFVTKGVEGRFAKPREIIELLGLDPVTTRVVKRETRLG